MKCYMIPVESLCTNDCVFCTTKQLDIKEEYKTMDINDQFYKNLNELKDIKCFEITGGGEPFLNINLNKIVDLIKNNAYVKVYTNGTILRKIHNIDELNISLVHYKTEIDRLYTSRKIDIIDTLEYFRENYDCLLRLSVVLLKGVIDSNEKIHELIDNTKDYVDDYVFRTLLSYTDKKIMDKYYVNIDNKKLNIDRNDTPKEKIIWWSNNKLYKTWRLE